jgi:ABC-type branched-subunit amino acid transport system ATPase component
MSTLLEITGLYGGYEKDVNILQGIDLTVAKGEAVGIIGLNGSGKSTLGKAVMNLIPYRSGSIVFDGQPIGDLCTHELAQLGIALMHQGGAVFPNLSVWQNLQLALGSVSRTAETQNFVSLQSVIPLLQKPRKELMRTMADKLSGGQRHELALAMTLSRRPKLVILDEPSAGLSPKAVEEMYEMLGEVRENFGLTVVLVEQNILRAVKFCSRCLLLNHGVFSQEFVGENLGLNEIESVLFNNL